MKARTNFSRSQSQMLGTGRVSIESHVTCYCFPSVPRVDPFFNCLLFFHKLYPLHLFTPATQTYIIG